MAVAISRDALAANFFVGNVAAKLIENILAISVITESRIKRTILNKMEVLDRNILPLSGFLWVKYGVYQLFRSRRVLCNSYPFAFYMFGDESILLKDGITMEELETKQIFFEFQQHQLEEYVEKLSNILEKPFHLYGEDIILEIKREVTNLSSISDRLCKHLYELIETVLLGSLQFKIHSIVPYSTHGIEKTMPGGNIMSSYSTSKGTLEEPHNGGGEELNQG
ncbi:RING/U-box superfamily protein [Artemisia annua]|uniref:RING/U-box superfamily protein n=1 Tax=Artemisia annua TaxID=35608 RepID=A0A2U1M6U7_ARTAN|nr:RING/U-box superfamily protein [Artemisia annua]